MRAAASLPSIVQGAFFVRTCLCILLIGIGSAASLAPAGGHAVGQLVYK